MSKEHNQFLEMDGLFYESDTHEWYHDKINTRYAQTDNGLNKDALPHIVCFVVRDKTTGEYDRVVMDKRTNLPIYDTKSLEQLGFYIDTLKVELRFKDAK
jgi:hypothetical protein